MTASDVVFALAAFGLGAGVGVVVGYRRGVAATWLTAVAALVWSTRLVHLQLARFERAEVERREVEDAGRFLPDGRPRMSGNPAGYRSAKPLHNDSPTRVTGGRQPEQLREVTR